MPQIRCPNCGTLINLEKRKKVDEYLILNALRKGQKTFTELMRESRIPRKTLSLRLKKLIDSGLITKDGGYRLASSTHKHTMWRGINLKKSRFVRENMAGKSSTFILIGLIAFAMASNFTMSLASSRSNLLTFKIKISGAVDLYAWQTKVVFDPNILTVVDIEQGDFLSSKALTVNSTIINIPPPEEINKFEGDSIFVFNSRIGYGAILVGESRIGDVPGVSGDGTLATITFSIRRNTGVFYPCIESSLLFREDNQNTFVSAEGVVVIEK